MEDRNREAETWTEALVRSERERKGKRSDGKPVEEKCAKVETNRKSQDIMGSRAAPVSQQWASRLSSCQKSTMFRVFRNPGRPLRNRQLAVPPFKYVIPSGTARASCNVLASQR